MEILGKITFIGPLQGGTSAKGTQWSKVDFVVEELKDYPNSAVISAMGDKVQELTAIKVGSEVKVAFDIRAREYNGRWYNSLNMFRIENLVQQAPAQQPQTQYVGMPQQGQYVPQRPQQNLNFQQQSSGDQLPF